MENHYKMIANLYVTTKNQLNTDDILEVAIEMSKSLHQTVDDTLSDLQWLYNKGFKL